MNVDAAYRWLRASTPPDADYDPGIGDDLLADLLDGDIDIDGDPADAPADEDFDIPRDDLADADDVPDVRDDDDVLDKDADADPDDDPGYCPLCGDEHDCPDNATFCASSDFETLEKCVGLGHADTVQQR